MSQEPGAPMTTPEDREALAAEIERHVDNDILSNRAWIDGATRYLLLAAGALRAQAPAPSDVVESVARIIDPGSWIVMDGYLEDMKRKYRDQNFGWPADQFQHEKSMAKARTILAALSTIAEARAGGIEEGLEARQKF